MIGSVFQLQEEALAEKRRKAGREQAADPEATTAASDAHAAAEGFQQAMDAGDEARKTARDRGITLGPGTGRDPGHPQPADFDRRYVTAGHASPSPMAGPPRTNPMPGMQHVVLPSMPAASAIPPGVPETYSMRSPSER